MVRGVSAGLVLDACSVGEWTVFRDVSGAGCRRVGVRGYVSLRYCGVVDDVVWECRGVGVRVGDDWCVMGVGTAGCRSVSVVGVVSSKALVVCRTVSGISIAPDSRSDSGRLTARGNP